MKNEPGMILWIALGVGRKMWRGAKALLAILGALLIVLLFVCFGWLLPNAERGDGSAL